MKSNYFSKGGIFFLKLLARLPFKFLYILSDIFYILIYYLVGYRKKVVKQNLMNAFPEKDSRELKIIAKKFYRHFSDFTLETLKLHNMKEKDFRERMKIANREVVDQYFDKGQGILILNMHYSNWEWTHGFPLYFKKTCISVYKTLHNKHFDSFIKKNRERMGGELIPSERTLRRLITAKKNNECFMMGLAADQTPLPIYKSWYRFLNQDAMFYPGPATLSKKFKLPLIMITTKKTGRGRYENHFEVLFDDTQDVSDAEIFSKYIAKMECIIKENPEYYLWSHRRWKHKRPEGAPLLN